MKLYWNEITEQASEFAFTEAEPWVLQAVAANDETTGDATRSPAPSRPANVRFTVHKVDDVVVITGKLKTHLNLCCSRCGKPFEFNCSTPFSSLYCKDPEMAGVAYLQRTRSGEEKPAGQNKGKARHAHDFEAASENEDGASSGVSSSGDLDITYLSEDFIDLGDVLTEQLQFQIPFQPLCSASCKGVCTICGTDLNAGRCACAKAIRQSPFAGLASLKIK